MGKRLNKITFTGIDKYTDKNDLVKISKEFHVAEFGFLHSVNWRDNGNRHPDPVEMKRLFDTGVNYSLHLCGEFAGKALVGDFENLRKSLGKQVDCFTRMQLNIVGRKPKDKYVLAVPSDNIKQIIVQVCDVDHMQMFDMLSANSNFNCTPLFDVSGGRGKYEPISENMFLCEAPYIGIAGGIRPNNCVTVVEDIMRYDFMERPFWIDMETGIRDNQDRFSTDACYEVCKRLRDFI